MRPQYRTPSHEMSETITDYANAWRDSSGAEDGDECAYVYGAPLPCFLTGSGVILSEERSDESKDLQFVSHCVTAVSPTVVVFPFSAFASC